LIPLLAAAAEEEHLRVMAAADEAPTGLELSELSGFRRTIDKSALGNSRILPGICATTISQICAR
jgi:hypothetical protein